MHQHFSFITSLGLLSLLLINWVKSAVCNKIKILEDRKCSRNRIQKQTSFQLTGKKNRIASRNKVEKTDIPLSQNFNTKYKATGSLSFCNRVLKDNIFPRKLPVNTTECLQLVLSVIASLGVQINLKQTMKKNPKNHLI